MKKIFFILGLLFLAVVGYFVYSLATTRSHSPADTISVNVKGADISISYCRPYKKGRVIFGELVPYDAYWRTGANDATEITFSKDVKFGDKEVKAGSYRFYTIPSKDVWTIALNSELKQWGYGDPNYDLDVTRIQVPSQKTSEVVEQFTITIVTNDAKADLALKWDMTEVVIPITPL